MMKRVQGRGKGVRSNDLGNGAEVLAHNLKRCRGRAHLIFELDHVLLLIADHLLVTIMLNNYSLLD